MKFMENHLINAVRRICYVHGYGGSAEGETAQLFHKIGTELGYETYAVDYNPTTPYESLHKLDNFFEANDIDLVIGCSLGGFMALYGTTRFRLIINPCMKPSEELPKIGYEGPIDEFQEIEGCYHNFDIEDSVIVRVLFGTDDELLGNKYEEMIRIKFAQTSFIKSGHRPDEETWRNIIFPEIANYFKDMPKLIKQL